MPLGCCWKSPPFKNCLQWRWGKHLVGSLEFSNSDVWKERCEQWQGGHLEMSREPWRDEVICLCCSCFDSCVAWACVRKQAVILIEVHSFSDKWLWVLRLARTWAAEGAALMVLWKKLLAYSPNSCLFKQRWLSLLNVNSVTIFCVLHECFFYFLIVVLNDYA